MPNIPPGVRNEMDFPETQIDHITETLCVVEFLSLEKFVVSSATDEVVITILPLHPLTSLASFNGESLLPWRIRLSNQVAGGNNF